MTPSVSFHYVFPLLFLRVRSRSLHDFLDYFSQFSEQRIIVPQGWRNNDSCPSFDLKVHHCFYSVHLLPSWFGSRVSYHVKCLFPSYWNTHCKEEFYLSHQYRCQMQVIQQFCDKTYSTHNAIIVFMELMCNMFTKSTCVKGLHKIPYIWRFTWKIHRTQYTRLKLNILRRHS